MTTGMKGLTGGTLWRLILCCISTSSFAWGFWLPSSGRFLGARRVSATAAAAASATNEWVSLDPNALSVGERYRLLTSAVVPRPVAVISTRSIDGVVNCAPFSYTSLSSHDPPIVTHGIAVSQGSKKKDTLQNIEDTGEWVFHILTKTYLTKANDCAATLPSDQDETAAFDLPTLDCDEVNAPRLEEAAVALECKLWDKKEVMNDQGIHTTTIVMGRVVRVHVHESVLKEQQDEDSPPVVDLIKLQAVGRAGDITYWPVGVTHPETETLPMPRPQ